MIASIVEDDIAFGPENLGVPREEIVERVEGALEIRRHERISRQDAHKAFGAGRSSASQ